MAVKTDLKAPPDLHELQTAGSLALFLDFDGTLVEIAATPHGIAVRDGLVAALEALADRLDGRLALVSGRAVDDLQRHLGPLRLACAGSHGASRLRRDGSRLGGEPPALGAEARAELAQFAAREGVDLEEKQHGAALHYRADPAREGTVQAFADDLARRHGLAVKRGKCVAEIVHRGADKAGAVHAFMAEPEFAGAMPVFVGDDITDEDGFRAARELGGFGIVVGERTGTLANYRLETVRDVHQWLKL